jgi:hypothetical protein
MSNKKSSEPMSASLPQIPQGSSTIEFDSAGDPMIHIDNELVESLEEQISEKKNEIRNKFYAISCGDDLFEAYETFMQSKAEWVSTEALGIVEVNKQIAKIKKEGIKDKTIYLGALPLEASHYFLSKTRGVGLSQAEDFLKLYKAFDQALADAKKDAAEIKDLEKQLAAANQGLSLG